MSLFANTYRGKRVLLTGHTGFKGSWLALWLHELGAKVTGVALTPEHPLNHWELLQLPIEERCLDIRNSAALSEVFNDTQPEIVFHLAAQALVRRSYQNPLETWSSNVMGTANLLEACRQTPSVKAIVVITTDKCYENKEWPWGYRENDRLGGHDPYSASKASAELLVASYRSAFFNSAHTPLLATARAGNVIGGGDWAADRLIPDLVRAVGLGQSLEIRSPEATRPWQHVLESLSAYLALGQRLLQDEKAFADAWNFGPGSEGNGTVASVLDKLKAHWPSLGWHVTSAAQPHESTLLYLDNSKARAQLHWQNIWSLDTTLAATAAWYRAFMAYEQIISREQLAAYIAAARQAKVEWAKQ